jgi:hypothetical protein
MPHNTNLLERIACKESVVQKEETISMQKSTATRKRSGPEDVGV